MKKYLCVLLSLVVFTHGKTFTRCELATELQRQGFARNQLADWVCLVEAESSGRTDALGRLNQDGSTDYGLFQINDRYWCSSSDQPGMECHIRCNELLTDDITIASECAKLIYKIQGFPAWVGWNNKCNNKPLPDLSPCHL